MSANRRNAQSSQKRKHQDNLETEDKNWNVMRLTLREKYKDKGSMLHRELTLYWPQYEAIREVIKAKIECVKCNKRLEGLGVKCKYCPNDNMIFCIDCFTLEQQFGEHKSFHCAGLGDFENIVKQKESLKNAQKRRKLDSSGGDDDDSSFTRKYSITRKTYNLSKLYNI